MSKIDDNPAAAAEFLSVRRWQAGSEWRPAAHSHPFCEVVVVLRGKENIAIAGQQLICEPGHVMFYPPHCVHEERQEGDVLLEFLCVEFTWNYRSVEIPFILHDRQGRLLEMTRWLAAEEHQNYPGKEEYQRAGVQMLTGELMRLVKSPTQDAVGQAQAYIHENFREPLTLDDLAACCNTNKFHLARMFRARTGLTPMEYVRHARLDIALRLLLESDLPLREIAPRVGLADEYHLSRLLKARYGRGARELRRTK